jgi:hypothetical protein
MRPLSITKRCLADEQRVAFGLTLHQFGKWLGNGLLTCLSQQPVDLVGGQSVHPRDIAEPVQLGQCRR